MGPSQCLSFPRHSWVDLPQVYDHLHWRTLHFQHFPTLFCLPPDRLSSPLPYWVHLIRGDDHLATLIAQSRLSLPWVPILSICPCSHPLTRAVLTASNSSFLPCLSEYFEALVALVDTPY